MGRNERLRNLRAFPNVSHKKEKEREREEGRKKGRKKTITFLAYLFFFSQLLVRFRGRRNELQLRSFILTYAVHASTYMLRKPLSIIKMDLADMLRVRQTRQTVTGRQLQTVTGRQLQTGRQFQTGRQLQADSYRQTVTDRQLQTDRRLQTEAETGRQTVTDRQRQTDRQTETLCVCVCVLQWGQRFIFRLGSSFRLPVVSLHWPIEPLLRPSFCMDLFDFWWRYGEECSRGAHGFKVRRLGVQATICRGVQRGKKSGQTKKVLPRRKVVDEATLWGACMHAWL
jgi:hypothetical protein